MASKLNLRMSNGAQHTSFFSRVRKQRQHVIHFKGGIESMQGSTMYMRQLKCACRVDIRINPRPEHEHVGMMDLDFRRRQAGQHLGYIVQLIFTMCTILRNNSPPFFGRPFPWLETYSYKTTSVSRLDGKRNCLHHPDVINLADKHELEIKRKWQYGIEKPRLP
jgi:hypothetical protein